MAEPARRDVVIVGNGVAGFAAADRLARNGVRPLVVGPGPIVDRPPLTKGALAEGELRKLADGQRLAELGIARDESVVEDADLAARRLVLRRGNERVEVHASHVVLATGLRYDPPPIPGLDEAHVNSTPEGLAPLAAELASGPCRVLIVGAGLIGVETAATLAVAGHHVTLIDLEPRPLGRLHDPLPQIALETLTELGVKFRGGSALAAVERRGDGTLIAIDADDAVIAADVLVAATGGRARPIPGLPEQRGPVFVDRDMSVPGFAGVFAVGDCAAPLHERFGRLELPHWDTAIGTGTLAADAILERSDGYRRLPYWWSDIGPRRFAEVGVAAAVAAWAPEDGLHVGRDAHGSVVSVLVVDQPRRLRDARRMVSAE